MIPIGLPSYEFLLIRLAYLAATLIWVAWALRLAFGERAEWRLRTWRGPIFFLLGGSAFYSTWSVYDLNRELKAHVAQQQADYHPVLDRRQRLGGIDMPLGTKLNLAVARELGSFQRAEFPHSISVGGVNALLAERYLSIHTDDAYQTAGYTPQNLRLTGVGISMQAGWICDASEVIVLETHPDGAPKAFQSCSAAGGNLIEGKALPNGAEIIASEGSLFLDGRRGLDRWLIHLPKEGALQLKGGEQIGGAILLDGDRKVIKSIPQ
ncbi:hypothetical protein FNJ84_21630 [Paracoccus sp. M683]|uniref:hypothetical protein n=1 Tax=Paracoccus sp. M683 TaxID=2594268 RepID=UPI00117CA073|nr:hypothetical protein [Paracoccus sp. M683]TRW91352.1 hypothetical protein FNJ84_21630 [Paracoccus sp. M683]